MSFPYHDRFWTDAADSVARDRAPKDSVRGDDLFCWRFQLIARHSNTQLRPGERYDWAIFPKGELNRLASGFLSTVHAEMHPVCANEVFVVWTRRAYLPAIQEADPHLSVYFGFLRQVERPALPAAQGIEDPLSESGGAPLGDGEGAPRSAEPPFVAWSGWERGLRSGTQGYSSCGR